ncbi:LPXTG cell wall anchor domain-containing protein [Enterococcus devriesei]|uniref:LPXTG cell wall anchor domain-containing protein n=1 Tax=Enterococcus devriesei TaxID=319970 RepID=UPI0036D2C7F8
MEQPLKKRLYSAAFITLLFSVHPLTVNGATQEYLIDGAVYRADQTSTENLLTLHGDQGENFVLHRDGSDWYTDTGKVQLVPYIPETTVEKVEAESSSTENSESTTVSSQIETTIEPATSSSVEKQSTPEISATLFVPPVTIEKAPQPEETVISSEATTSVSDTGNINTTPVSSEATIPSTENISTVASVVPVSHVFHPENRSLPKTGSDQRSGNYFTFAGFGLLISLFSWLWFVSKKQKI